MDNIGERIDGRGLGGTGGGAGGGGTDGGTADGRDKWGWAARNSSPVGRLSSRVSKVSSLQARVPGLRARGGSSLSLSEGKKSDGSWFFRVLGGDSGCEGSRQLELFEVEMVAVHESMTLIAKLDLLLCLVLGRGQAQPLRSRVQSTREVYTS